jgi:NAD+ kinase
MKQVLSGKYFIEERIRLLVHLHRHKIRLWSKEVINDVVISKGAIARMADLETNIDDVYLTTFKADGIIVSTPTGSTAYSMSAGGPIIYPTLEMMVLTPICPHTLSNRPLIVSPYSQISITLKSEGDNVYVTLDGQYAEELEAGDRIEVKISKNRIKLVKSHSSDYFKILRTKLRWGGR